MRKKISLLLFILPVFVFSAFSQRNGIITGTLVDASNGEPLFFANVSLKGTSLGAVTDEYGEFELKAVPPGDYTLTLLYVGYESKDVPVSVNAGETVNIGTQEMVFESVMGEEVVVTGQLRGQASAINQQVKSNKIVNVVSKEKIEEVPDANAAESLSRLPGITLSRSGGEGSQVTVRGVSPRFNSITVNGQTMPATGNNDRSVNLSMISSDLLDGIEVYKAITPDMDADAVGGTVNLVTKTADPGLHGRVHVETGYHSLISDIGTYRGSFTLGNRFLEDKLGILVGANYHRANRNVDFFEGDYELSGDGGYRGNSAEFTNRLETRDRYGISGALDFEFETGKLILDHVFTQTDRDIIERRMRARPTISVIGVSIGLQENYLSLNSTNLRGEFDLFNSMELTFNAGRSKTTNETPDNFGAGAEVENGLTPEANDAVPLDMFRFADYEVGEFYGGVGTGSYNNLTTDENYTGQVDLKLPFYLGSRLSGDIKFGGKIRQKQRERNNNSYQVFDFTEYEQIFRGKFPEYTRDGTLYPVTNFIDEEYTGYDSPFESHNDIPFVFDPDIIRLHHETMFAIDSLFRKNVNNRFDDYEALERITAGYIMAEIDLGTRITLIPGFRYENTYIEYSGLKGSQRNNEPFRVNATDTTADNTSGVFLPMVHLKYEFIDGLNLRLAATRTLSRPNFLNLTPFTQRLFSNLKEVELGAIDLKIPTAWNYDAMVTWFSKFGLISVGGFYKEIYDIDIKAEFFDWSGSDDPDAEDYNPNFGWQVNSPINLEETTTVYGGEMELQTNFRFLPKPFDGLVLSGNYSIIRSESYYPFFYTAYPPPDYLPVTTDSFRINDLQGQADFIANLTLGYEKGGFSGRISMNYQGAKFSTLGNSPFQDEFEDEYLRWDAALTYKFDENWQVLVNLINITNETERNYIYTDSQPSEIEQYGWQANLGVRYRF